MRSRNSELAFSGMRDKVDKECAFLVRCNYSEMQRVTYIRLKRRVDSASKTGRCQMTEMFATRYAIIHGS